MTDRTIDTLKDIAHTATLFSFLSSPLWGFGLLLLV